ncbi:cholinephosphotransferase 1 isoform X1 [Tachysurus fulvidraco]|uniref:cholinephosphotransferase 1 isoform X1 n=1 Tax=Tachysurus fulvidraco TaxID=1234273 RepID=UPI001FEFFF1C|nr:cholinephosphotransferase 1 isoform X1 [Tachysurus fulvidraco]
MALCMWPEPLSPAQLKRLEQHKYSASGRSLLEPPCQIYWNWLVEQIPTWLAPNTLTITGLIINVFTTIILVFYCPTATEEAPSWAFILSALGLFIYQSLDAIDGKQARRTNSSSALGELFDHGCDAVSTVFVAVGSCICAGIGAYPNWMFFCGFVGMFIFFCAHWQTYVSGTLRFGIVDVTEVQIAIIIMYLMSAFGGVSLWETMLPGLGIKLQVLPILGIIGGFLLSTYNYFLVILSGGVGKNGSTVAAVFFKVSSPQDTSVLSPGLHIGLVLTLAFIIFKKSSSQLFEHHPCLYILTFGTAIAKISNKLVVAQMTRSTLYLSDTAFIGPCLLFLNQYFNSFIDEYIVLWIALVLSVVDLSRYCTGVCLQIAAHLRIHVFSITPPGHARKD